jgi:hypothetical protein
MNDMITFLSGGGYPQGMDKTKRRQFRLQSIPYALVDHVLFRKDLNGVLLRCINSDQVNRMLEEFHDGPNGGHFTARTIAMKIMRAGYYWPTLFCDAHRHVRRCTQCAFFSGKQRLAALPLHPIQVDQPFTQWGLDFIGPINPPSSAGHKWILATTDYFTRWTEAVALKDATEPSVVEFLEEIATRFGAPSTIISDNAKSFIGSGICSWAVDRNVYLSTSSNYYPQGNGLAESSNKNLIKIMKRTVGDNQRTWHKKLKNALWADRITPKRSIGNSPFMLVYGREARLPISLEFPALELAHQLEIAEDDAMSVRMAELMELEEKRDQALHALDLHQ